MILPNTLNRLQTEINNSGSNNLFEACEYIYQNYGIHIYIHLLPRGYRGDIQYRLGFAVQTQQCDKKSNSPKEAYNTAIQTALDFIANNKFNFNKTYLRYE